MISVVDRTYLYSAKVFTDTDLMEQIRSVYSTVMAYLDPEWTDFDQLDADRWNGHGTSLSSYGMTLAHEINLRSRDPKSSITEDEGREADNIKKELVGLQYLLLDIGQAVTCPKWVLDDDLQASDLIWMINEGGSDKEHYRNVLQAQYPLGNIPEYVPFSTDKPFARRREVTDRYSEVPEDAYSDPFENKKDGVLTPVRLDLTEDGIPSYRSTWWFSAKSGMHLDIWLRAMSNKLIDIRITVESTGAVLYMTAEELSETQRAIKNCNLSNKPWYASDDTEHAEPKFNFTLPIGAANAYLYENAQEEEEGIFSF